MISEEQYDLLVEVTFYYLFVVLTLLVKWLIGSWFVWLMPFTWLYATGLRLCGFSKAEYALLWWL